MKTCSKCKEEKQESMFWKHPNTKDGLCPSCKECGRKARREYAKTDNWKESCRKWREKHKEHLQKYRREYYSKRKATDPQFRIAIMLRKRIRNSLKKLEKNGSAVKDLGCTVKELKIYMEKMFVDGMSWKNHGEWHIDHIIPLASFDLTDREQFLKAVHYTNLQPLWARENISKGCRVLT